MRFIKTAFSLLLVLLLAVSVVVVPASADTEVRYGKSILLQMDNAEALAFAYDQLVDGCAVAAQGVDFRHDTYCISTEETSMVYDLFCRDYPEYFWLNGGYGSAVLGTQTVELYPNYNMSGDALLEAQADFNAQTEQLIRGLAGKTDYEKALILHDRLAEVVTYELSGHHQTAYGALVGGKAVCAGYSRAYQHLMQTAGLTAWYVTGWGIDSVTGHTVAHGWNLVKLDGDWYYTDVTWDDQGEALFYTYFNVTSAQMAQGHVVDEFADYLPTATATANNYYVKNNLIVKEIDTAELAQLFLANRREVQLYIDGDLSAYKQSFSNAYLDVITQMGAAPGAACGYSIQSLGATVIISLQIQEDTHTYENACDGECDVCGATRSVADHVYSDDQDATCNECGAIREIILPYVAGDLNGDTLITDADAVHLLMHTFFADFYPVNQDCDFNGDGKVSDADAVYLLMYTFFPDFYPIA